MSNFSEKDLEAYLDEALPPPEMAAVEEAMRGDSSLGNRLAFINERRNAGLHTLGEIWRRHRISCPTREELGGFLLETLAKEHSKYVQFHLTKVGCRLCQANLEDLRRDQLEDNAVVVTRRRKYFQSSAGYLGDEER